MSYFSIESETETDFFKSPHLILFCDRPTTIISPEVNYTRKQT